MAGNQRLLDWAQKAASIRTRFDNEKDELMHHYSKNQSLLNQIGPFVTGKQLPLYNNIIHFSLMAEDMSEARKSTLPKEEWEMTHHLHHQLKKFRKESVTMKHIITEQIHLIEHHQKTPTKDIYKRLRHLWKKEVITRHKLKKESKHAVRYAKKFYALVLPILIQPQQRGVAIHQFLHAHQNELLRVYTILSAAAFVGLLLGLDVNELIKPLKDVARLSNIA